MSVTSNTSLKSLLAELVQMPTLTLEKGTGHAAMDWFKYQVRDLPLHIHDYAENGYSALVLSTRPGKRAKVMLTSHLDVVPAPVESFQLTERDGKLFGRGVFDMKFATAIYLRLLLDLGPKLADYDLSIMLTTDEEVTGGVHGAGALVAAGWGADVVVNPDSVTGWAIQRAAKGSLSVRVSTTGTAGHGSRPWLYPNAINELMDYLQELATRFPAEPCHEPEHAHNTLNVGSINGGAVNNQVAAAASADINLRFMPGQTIEDMQALLAEVAAPFPSVNIDTFAVNEPVFINTDHPYVQRLGRIMREVTGVSPAYTLAHGASESDFFASKGMPVLMFGPPGGGHHGDDEWIDAEGFEHCARIIRTFVDEVAGPGTKK